MHGRFSIGQGATTRHAIMSRRVIADSRDIYLTVLFRCGRLRRSMLSQMSALLMSFSNDDGINFALSRKFLFKMMMQTALRRRDVAYNRLRWPMGGFTINKYRPAICYRRVPCRA